MTKFIDFNDLSTGTVVDNEFNADGVTISATGGSGKAMIFDTAHPTGNDHDLATTNLNKALIISEDGDSHDPDDEAGGGTLRFDFDDPSSINRLTFLDIEEGAKVKFFDADGHLIKTVDVHKTDDNGQIIVDFDVDDVARMDVVLHGSGAIDNLVFAPTTGDGIVEGDNGDDLIDINYVDDPEGDRIDADDQILPGEAKDDDIVDALGGDDTVKAGEGDDDVYAGSGSDSVQGGAGDDLIYGDSNYAGENAGVTTREVFEWEKSPFGDGNNLGGFTQDTGNVDVTFSIIQQSGASRTIQSNDDQNVANVDGDGNTIDDNSSLDNVLNGHGNSADYKLEFSDEVEDVSFRINDIDGDGVVYVKAFDADGNQIVVNLEGGENLTMLDTDGVAGNDTADSNGGYKPDTSSEYSVLVSIPGPVAKIVIEHSQDGGNNSGINITDVYFDATVADTGDAGNDTLEGGSGNDTIFGEDGDDVISGGSGKDVLDGGDGNDTIGGGGGADLITGGEGDDMVEAAFGNDTIDGGAGNDDLWASGDDDLVNGGDGNDNIHGGQGKDVLNGDADDDTIYGGSDNDTIDGGTGDDLLFGDGNFKDDTGAPGNDLIEGGTGNDTIDGMDGDDTLLGGDNNDSIMGGDGDDFIDGGAQKDELFGGDGNDTILGGNGADSIEGGAGDDSIDGGTGGDTDLSGGTGNDTIIGATGRDTIDGGDDADLIFGGAGDVIDGGAGGFDTDPAKNTDLDVLDLTGQGRFFIDNKTVDSNGNGFNGTVVFVDSDGNPTGLTLTFTEIEEIVGDEVDPLDGIVSNGDEGALIDVNYDGDPEGDVVDGGDNIFSTDPDKADDDIIEAGGGNDTIIAGEGDDSVNAGTGDDQVHGGPGNDTLNGEEGEDTINGGAGNDSVDGGADDDEINTGDGNDTVEGGTGNDLIDTGNGEFLPDLGFPNDDGTPAPGFPFGFAADDTPDDDLDFVDGGDGDDTISTGDDADTIIGGDGNDVIDGGIDDDVIQGDDSTDPTASGDDLIVGGEGNDLIEGGSGNDTIYAGNDPALGLDQLNIEDDGSNALFPADPVPENGKDTVFGGDGNDVIFGADDDDELFGEEGNDTIDGEIDDDFIDGGIGDDSLLGGQGNDTIEGGDGADFIDGGDQKDTLFGGDGDDTIFGGNGADEIDGGEGNDLIDGGTGSDSKLDGGAGNDTIFGSTGRDTIDGGDGNDLIDLGNSGAGDVAAGGADRDTFVNVTAGDAVDGGGDGDDFDTLDLRGSTPPGGSLKVVFTNPDANGNGFDGVVNYFDSDGNAAGSLTFTDIEDVIPCFTPGTLIATPMGERRVEDLKAGDRVITRDNGIQEIRWVGHRDMTGQELASAPHLRPILIRQGALGKGLPERDMLVSPQHRVLISNDKTALYFEESEVLVAAKHLTDMDGIDMVEVSDTTYIHVMFDHHEVILSDGAWTESFQPGDMTLGAMGDAQRAEILELFPELATADGVAAYASARRSLKKHEAQLLSQ
ncbi:MAG: Hint domain-containing protein [Pseudomonadota bacterium]